MSALGLDPWGKWHAVAMIVAAVVAAWLRVEALAAVVAGASLGRLVYQERTRWTPRSGFGLANVVTTVRVLLTLLLLLTSRDLGHPAIAGIAALILFLDVVDGWTARRCSLVSDFGARYDVEADAIFVLVLSLILRVHSLAGAWVLLAGLWRYLYVLAPLLFSTSNPEGKRSRIGRLAYVTLIVAFLTAFLVPVAQSAACAVLGTLAVSASFAWSFWLRYGPLLRS